MRFGVRALIVAWLSCVSVAHAHELHHDVAAGEAVVVTLRYADGTPFAYEEAEVRRDGERTPILVTRSDALGRVVFVPDGEGPWIVRTFSADGHGAEVRVDAASLSGVTGGTEAFSPVTGLMRVGLGVLFILALFAILSRITRSRRPYGGQDHA